LCSLGMMAGTLNPNWVSRCFRDAIEAVNATERGGRGVEEAVGPTLPPIRFHDYADLFVMPISA
jgi:hypothetical protein